MEYINERTGATIFSRAVIEGGGWVPVQKQEEPLLEEKPPKRRRKK